MEWKNWLHTTLTVTLILAVTTVLFLYTAGYRLDQKKAQIDLRQTGMISAKSIPNGASVYLDDKLLTATDGTISALTPGKYNLKIVKTGFVEWKKQIEVFPELVTDITAVLVSQTPRLEPLTNTGARLPTVSPSLTKLAYFSTDAINPGISVIALGQSGLSIFRSTPTLIVKDLPNIKYSSSISMEWSPDEQELLVDSDVNTHFIVDLQKDTVESTATPKLLTDTWAAELLKKRMDFIQKLDLPADIAAVAVDPASLWAPDEKKFLYTKRVGLDIEYRVYNMEKPIPVGESVENLVFTTKAKDIQPKVGWYADSFHLILTENYNDTQKKGTVSIIRIDGTNKTEVYNNTLFSDSVFSSAGGDKLIMLTSYKSNNQSDLYTIGIR
ncbi:MAG TPA: PEGA domain-containing protein [Candidatus Saccharimonadales bacterium]|nr:PEGA domain-containing protein [Candidatus Saccharimonadales bacterium]